MKFQQEYHNIFTKRLYNKFHASNYKYNMQFYIPKKLYDLFDYVILYPNRWNLEFFTLNPNYKYIWSQLRISKDYGRTNLIDLGYDENNYCYVVDVICPDLIRYIQSMNDHLNTISEKIWKNRALSIGWSEDSVNEGYVKYKKRCDDVFEMYYGKHISLYK